MYMNEKLLLVVVCVILLSSFFFSFFHFFLICAFVPGCHGHSWTTHTRGESENATQSKKTKTWCKQTTHTQKNRCFFSFFSFFFSPKPKSFSSFVRSFTSSFMHVCLRFVPGRAD